MVLAGAPIAKAQEQKQRPAASIEALNSDIKVTRDGAYVQTLHVELKAANEAGAMQISRVNMPFSAGLQTIEVVEAYTEKSDGRKVPVDLSTVFEQLPQQAAQSGMITDQRIKVIFFPQFSAGDKAVYTIKIASPHPLFPGEFFLGQAFPRAIAYKDVRQSITAPKAMELKVESHDIEFSKSEDGENLIYRWHYAQPVPRKTGPVFVSPLDHEPRFFVSTFKDYTALGKAYAELSAPKKIVTAKAQALADKIAASGSHKEQAQKLYEWVVHNIRYVAIELGQGSFVPHDVDDILTKGYGDCKDHDLLLQVLLKAKGIESESILINASNAYTLTEAPTFAQLDHVITHVPELSIYLDASVPVAQFGVLPLTEYGKPMVRATLKTAGAGTMPVMPFGLSSMRTVTVQKLGTDGTISGTTTSTATGAYALSLRLVGFVIQAVGSEKAAQIQLAARGFKDGKGKLNEDPPLALSNSYKINGEFTVKGWEDVLKGMGTIMPGGLRVLPATGDEIMGPMYNTEETEAEPTACFSASAEEDVSLEVPQGFVFPFVPPNSDVVTPHLKYAAHWTKAGNRISVHRSFASHIDTALCSGAVRKEVAEAMKKIAASYDTNIRTLPASAVTISKTEPAPQAAPSAPITQLAAATPDLAAVSKGLKHLDGGEWVEAATAFEKASRSGVADASVLPYWCKALSRTEHASEASDLCSRAIKLSGGNTEVLEARGIALFKQGKYADAVGDFEQAVKLKPRNARYIYELGAAKSRAGDAEGGKSDILKALGINDEVAKFVPRALRL
ncbi:tetratricopeptide (TPR) repeat protein [Rhizomicrobium palustre]|uniref:Tetratricopeptide (TPR) repeat protein n=2 Tax=Rhizomicrobium palustre TaxID=189966 RepID=A0A846MVP2_9PROT|nr:tetratricopeptide (TPR) repeat protein [Rhizomicrobium palustre]